MKPPIYLDHNATTPLAPEVLEAMAPFWREAHGNPSSLHHAGRRVARALKEARREVAAFLGVQSETEIVFTSGGTESNNALLRSAFFTQKGKKRLVTTTVEHSSILKPARALQEEGKEISWVPVYSDGTLNLERLREALTEDTALVSVMMANNETGVLFPIEEIGKLVRDQGILFHVDAVQAVGKIPFRLNDLTVDFLSFSAHKFGGPKGVGGLFVRNDVAFRPLIFGGGQERGRRAGTENVPGIVGLGAACEKLCRSMSQDAATMRQLRDRFEEQVLHEISGVHVNGSRENRLPNTSNQAFEGVDAEALLILLDEEGVSASSGAACISGAPEPSHVLKAMALTDERAKSSVRFSFGPENTAEEVTRVVSLLRHLVARLREIEFKEQHPHPTVR